MSIHIFEVGSMVMQAKRNTVEERKGCGVAATQAAG